MDISKTNTSPSFPPPTGSSGFGSCSSDPNLPPVDPDARGLSDRFFVSLRKETSRVVKTQESEPLTLPWGPRIDVLFHPKGAPGIVGGRVRLLARTTGGGDIEIASATIASGDAPLSLSGSMGCDEYVVKVSSGTDPGPGARLPESYVFARVYDGQQ